LEAEGMTFSNIIRQWNYIEQITGNVGKNGKVSQHYQIFNDVRSKYYGLSNFASGYPAATGIGMDFGGIGIDFIAVQTENQNSVIGVKSPVQADAYRYTEAVLKENCAMSDFCRTTPKFERAKFFHTSENKWIFISGTAAIIGQDSADKDSIEFQTEMTIKNIQQLISKDNLLRNGINQEGEPTISYLRVYVKYRKDMDIVKQICSRYFKEMQIAYVVADICRPELLVEIEGQAVLQ
jgi:enamine deaminase RidA (YjgF/YER057c/UK114 family)